MPGTSSQENSRKTWTDEANSEWVNERRGAARAVTALLDSKFFERDDAEARIEEGLEAAYGQRTQGEPVEGEVIDDKEK